MSTSSPKNRSRFRTQSLCSALLLIGAFLLSSCGSSRISLIYDVDAGRKSSGPRVVSVGKITDERGDGDYYLGTIKTALVPVGYVQSNIPVADVVANAFSHALDARGMLASRSSSYHEITVHIESLYATQVINPYAEVILNVNVRDKERDRRTYQRSVRKTATSPPGRDAQSNLDSIRSTLSRALQEAVDEVVEDRRFRRAIGD